MFQSASFSQASFLAQSWKFTGVIPPTPIQTGGHYYDWWAKKWRDKFIEELPTLEEVAEFVEDNPVKAIEALQTVAPQIAIGVTPALLAINAGLIESIAKQLLISIKLWQIEMLEEDDIETMLLLG